MLDAPEGSGGNDVADIDGSGGNQAPASLDQFGLIAFLLLDQR